MTVKSKGKIAVIALGGNAIIPAGGKGKIEDQRKITDESMLQVAELVQRGYQIVMSHGNGPIVGNILIRNESAKSIIPPMPLDVCGADSMGGLGYMIQQSLDNQFHIKGLNKKAITLITQTLVDANDPAFQKPTKPIGPFYNAFEAEEMATQKKWTMIEDSGRGYRRVVPSPKPLQIVEIEIIRQLLTLDAVLIAGGGGGIPVIQLSDGALLGVEAVVDKDSLACLMAVHLNADYFILLTSTPQVAINFNKSNQTLLSHIGMTEAKKYYDEGQFPPGSMGPKILSALSFLSQGGSRVIITTPNNLLAAIEERAGTTITKDS